MVALLRLLDPMEVGLEVLVGEEHRAVDALELGVVLVAAPVGARHLRQLERLAEPARRRQVRAEAHVEPVALLVDRDLLVLRQFVGPFGFELLAMVDEVLLDLRSVPDLARDRQVAVDDLGHALLDLGKVLRRERLVAHEVVVEALVRRRAERDLRAGVEFLHRLGEHVRRIVAQQLERFRIARRHDADFGVVIHDRRKILHLAVDLHGQRRLGEARADRCGDLGTADRLVEFSDRTVRERNVDHGNHLRRRRRTRLTARREASADEDREAAQRLAPGRDQVRTVVSVVGAGKNNRSMRPEIETTGILVKSTSICAFRSS